MEQQTDESALAELERLNDMGGSKAVEEARQKALVQVRAMCDRHNLSGQPPQKDAARWWLLRGRVAAACERGGVAEAEECLSRAVKLDPSLAPAWCALGEVLLRKGDLQTSRLCFARSLDTKGSKEAFRGVSVVLRQIAMAPSVGQADVLGLHQESLKCAKEAVSMDVADGCSWSLLGNAVVARCLALGTGVDDLVQALRAYDKAESCGFLSPDLFYNRAAALSYCGENQKAVVEYLKAREKDSGWDAPTRECTRISELEDRIASLLVRKRPKSAAKVPPPTEALERRTEAMLDVVGVATCPGEAPLTIVADDGGSRRAVVCLYGVGVGAVKTGDVITVSRYTITTESFSWKRSTPLSYPLIRVGHQQLAINGNPVPRALLAMPIAVLTTST